MKIEPTSLHPSVLVGLSLLGVAVLIAPLLLFLTRFAVEQYSRVLKSWTPKGWYFSMVMLISDMARGKTKWQELHLAKVKALMTGLRKENPELFFRMCRDLEDIRRSTFDGKEDRHHDKDRDDEVNPLVEGRSPRKPLSLGKGR